MDRSSEWSTAPHTPLHHLQYNSCRRDAAIPRLHRVSREPQECTILPPCSPCMLGPNVGSGGARCTRGHTCTGAGARGPRASRVTVYRARCTKGQCAVGAEKQPMGTGGPLLHNPFLRYAPNYPTFLAQYSCPVVFRKFSKMFQACYDNLKFRREFLWILVYKLLVVFFVLSFTNMFNSGLVKVSHY